MKRLTIFATQLFIMLFACSSLHVAAQRKAAAEFSIYADGGVATYWFHKYNLPAIAGTPSVGLNTNTGTQFHQPTLKKTTSVGYSIDFGVGFTGFFSQQVGIHTSAGFGLLNVKSTRTLSNIAFDYVDQNGFTCELHTKLKNYTEIHKTMYVSIPVMFQFQTKQKQYWNWHRTQRAGFYAQAGVKIHLLFNNKFEASVDSLYRSAYYPELNNWASTQAFEGGFGRFPGATTEGKLDFGVLVLFAAETGVKWRIDNNLFVYTGIFFDCGLNDPMKDKRQPLDNLTNKEQLYDLTLLKFSDKTNLMVVGVKLRLAFTRAQRRY